MEPVAVRRHIRQIHFFVQSATGLFLKDEKATPCYVIFGINGSFYRTTPKNGASPEWNEVQQFNVSSDLLTLHVIIRDAQCRLAAVQVPIKEIAFSTSDPQKLELTHTVHSQLAPTLFYRSNILDYRGGFGNKMCDWVSQRLPLIMESFRNAQVIEWTWPNCRTSSHRNKTDQLSDCQPSTDHNQEAFSSGSPFISSIKEAIAVSTIFNNPNFLEGEQAEISSTIPRRATVHGGTRIIIGGSNFGLSISNIKLLLIAGSDCTKMIQSYSSNQIHVLTRRFYPVSSEIVIVTKCNGTAISDFEFTYYDESSIYRKMSCVPVMPTPKQYRNACTQTLIPQSDANEHTIQAERIGHLVDEVDKLRLENKRQNLYLDQLVSRIMEMCPAILASKIN
ncbi:hypothetical protein QR680_001836 [Steinernema hermaphroditum]|uniref:IPT/TIG domain-containing protein n=1 Tax=Steinernema hermaphroditum TaxID=289476 RepID=A0AA39H2X7_9BILA|nr:hypothetical protein QR680_001836 [Steinernema hermaphroditum]